MFNEFDFDIRKTKGKENRLAYALSIWVHVDHLAAMGIYGKNLQDRILYTGEQDVKYMEIVHKLQQGDNIGTSTYTSHGIGTCSGVGIGGSTGTCIGIGA